MESNVTYQAVLEHGLERSAELLNAGFADYFVPIRISALGLANTARIDSADLDASRVILRDGHAVGIALIARRGWTSRLAGMAIVPAARGQKVGEALMHHVLAQAKARGDHAMELEVIEQNMPAVHLYQKMGFQTLRRLVGYAGRMEANANAAELHQVDVRDFARALMAQGPRDLPWQISGETLAQMGPPSIAFSSGASGLALSDPAASTIVVHSIDTPLDPQGQGSAVDLLRAVSALYPGKDWRVPARFPEEMGGVFEKVGLVRTELTQWQMRIQFE